MKEASNQFDVVIIGAGLAGLSLARQLLLASDKKILLLDKRTEFPPTHQKVGESCVQVSGYYFSRVLGLEEHLLREHYLKYNLRFYWKTAGHRNCGLEDYSQSYIRSVSNVATYQLDRNKLEGELLRLNRAHPNFDFCAPAADISVSLADVGPHQVTFFSDGRQFRVAPKWVVDTSGRRRFLARQAGLLQPNAIDHGASFCWVEGLLNIENLTDLSPKENRLNKARQDIGHFPLWLATNHFVGEGFWFWVIPLQGKTSLGLVYDNRMVDSGTVSTPAKLVEWVCHEFPLFARDLPHRKILHYSSIKDFSYSCAETISSSRWAMSGEAGRFLDPLYSPGGDFISIHNTLITDAILTTYADELAPKTMFYERLMRSLYEAYIPGFAAGYKVLGDQEAFTLKYTWELSVYFGFYVFPFINDLFTDRGFVAHFLKVFSRLGPINSNLQSFISNYYEWKKSDRPSCPAPVLHDFSALSPLRKAESTFYRVGVSVDEAKRILDLQYSNLLELARYIVAYICSRILSDEFVLYNRQFIESIDFGSLRFDADGIRDCYSNHAGAAHRYQWTFDADVLNEFRRDSRLKPAMIPTGE